MIIQKIIYQHRRDFRAIYHCNNCGYEYEAGGYDDANFHENVIPNMVCPKCGKKEGEDYRPLTTKYPEGYQI